MRQQTTPGAMRRPSYLACFVDVRPCAAASRRRRPPKVLRSNRQHLRRQQQLRSQSSAPRRDAAGERLLLPGLFATATLGASPDTVHALLRCRGDINASACEACGIGAFEDAQQLCAYNKDATVFYELCELRYSDQDFLLSSPGTFGDDVNLATVRSPLNASAPAAVFDAAVAVLLNATADYAATKSPTLRFGTGVQMQSPTIFCLAQCTPNLTPAQCRKCLAYVMGYAASSLYCSGARGCLISHLSCGFAYHESKFFSGTPLVVHQPPAAAPPGGRQRKEGGKTHGRRLVLKITLPIVIIAGAATVVLLICCFLRRGRKTTETTTAAASRPDGMQSVSATEASTGTCMAHESTPQHQRNVFLLYQ